MTSTATKDSIGALIRRLKRRRTPEHPGFDEDYLELFIFSYLLWESTSSKAAAAMRRIISSVVDYNDLRISLPEEIVEMLGARYSLAEERALRLKASLNDIFRREDSVRLDQLAELSKREARQYLDTLDGIPPYVAARFSLVGLGAHACPVDSRLLAKLVNEGAVEDGVLIEEAMSDLEHSIKAADSLEAHMLLQGLSDTPIRSSGRKADGGARTSSSGSKKRAGARK